MDRVTTLLIEAQAFQREFWDREAVRAQFRDAYAEAVRLSSEADGASVEDTLAAHAAVSRARGLAEYL